MNSWCFTGNLGRDAEQIFIPSGESVVEFSVAVKSGFGKSESTVWPKCTVWGKRGEGALPYLKKGQQVAISGEVALREYDKKDGSGKGYSLEVRVNDITLLGGKREAVQDEHNTAKANAFQPPAATFAAFDDDIPFN